MPWVNALVLMFGIGCAGTSAGQDGAPLPPGGPAPTNAPAIDPAAAAWTPGAWTTPLLTAQAGAHLTAVQRARIDRMDAPLSGAWRVYTSHQEAARTALMASLKTGRPPLPAVGALVAAERGLRDVGVAPFLRLLRLVESGGRAALSGATWRVPVPVFVGPTAARVGSASSHLAAVLADASLPLTPARSGLLHEDDARVATVAEALRAWRIVILGLDLAGEHAPCERVSTAYTALSAALDADLEVRLSLLARLLDSVPTAQRAALVDSAAVVAWAGLDAPSAPPTAH